MSVEIFLGIMIFVLGLCVGSFINMALWRVENKKSFFKKQRSICDYCGKELRWTDNIPVISWILLKGKSQCCGKKLTILYPVVEITTGILFYLNFIYFRENFWLMLINLLISGLLVFEAAFDFQYMMLPDATAYALIILAGIKWILMGTSIFFLIYAVISALFIFILHKIKIRGQEAMGDGDILLAFFMGLFLGFPNIIVAFYVAFIVGAVIGGILMWFKKIGRMSPIPFGPFLILGTIIAYYWGENLLRILNL